MCLLSGSVNSAAYKEVLRTHLLPFLREHLPDGRLQQDNAPCHTSKSTLKLLKDNNVSLFPTPPDSTRLELEPGPEPDREHVARIKALYPNSHEATKQRGAFPRDKDIFGDSDTGEVLQIHKSLEEGIPQSPGNERRNYRLLNELGPSLHILFIYYT